MFVCFCHPPAENAGLPERQTGRGFFPESGGTDAVVQVNPLPAEHHTTEAKAHACVCDYSDYSE